MAPVDALCKDGAPREQVRDRVNDEEAHRAAGAPVELAIVHARHVILLAARHLGAVGVARHHVPHRPAAGLDRDVDVPHAREVRGDRRGHLGLGAEVEHELEAVLAEVVVRGRRQGADHLPPALQRSRQEGVRLGLN